MIAFVDTGLNDPGSSTRTATIVVQRVADRSLSFTLRSSLNVPLLRSIAFADEGAIRLAITKLRAGPDEAFAVRRSSTGFLVVFLSESGEILARSPTIATQPLANANRTLVMLQARTARPASARRGA